MKFDDLIHAACEEDVITTGWLTVGGAASQAGIRRQLDRWVKAGKVLQLRRGFYALADPWRRHPVNPLYVANRIKKASYVSLQSALAWYGMIPEYVPVTTSVTTGRPEILQTPLGSFSYQHIKPGWFLGYQQVKTVEDRVVFMATPEKALLDLLYLTPGSDDPGYLSELRFEPSDSFDWTRAQAMADTGRSPKLSRAVTRLRELQR
jgi:predicted transcriptional regulator of viral defense system